MRIIETAGVRRRVLLFAAAVAALAVVYLLLRTSPDGSDPEQPANTHREAAVAVEAPQRAQPPKFRPVRRSDEPPEAPPRAADDVRQGEKKPANADDPAPAPGEEDVPTGIALFPPPGTDPIKRGLIVPEDFELPPGYVRHYQATDDGQRLPAILMFHPDYDWVDANGEPIEVPADHIVPPELAPAGLPLQTLDVPEVVVPMIEEPGAGEAAD